VREKRENPTRVKRLERPRRSTPPKQLEPRNCLIFDLTTCALSSGHFPQKSMASRKRAISDTDILSDPRDRDQRAARKEPRLDPSLSPPSPRASSSLPYPSTSQPASHTVPFQRPLPLLTFSYDKDRELEFSDAAMRYYVSPPLGANLGHGYERWIRRPEERGRLDGLLRAVSEIRTRAAGDPVINIVSWRGVMTKCVPSHCLS
jgi:RAT1-interacting protein